MIAIDSSKVKGETGTGYEPPAGKGPFECGNCHYFQSIDSTCGQSTMRRVSKMPKTADGMVKVEAHGCCEYVTRINKAPGEAFRAAARKRVQ